MKLALAIEGSSATYAVAVGTAGQPAVHRVLRRDDPAFTGLGGLVEASLRAAGGGFADLGSIAVDTGPGSLTAVRSAVAYANGLAFSLRMPVFTANSLELMAAQARGRLAGPALCLRKAEGGNAYAGIFREGEPALLRYGPLRAIVPDLAAGLDEVLVAGAYRDQVPGLLPGTLTRDSGIEQPDALTLYRLLTGPGGDPERIVPAATPVTEGSRVFHAQTAAGPVRRG